MSGPRLRLLLVVGSADWVSLQLPTHLHHFTVPVLREWLTMLRFEAGLRLTRISVWAQKQP